MTDASRDGHDPSAALLARWQSGGDPDALDELLRIEIEILKARIRRQGRDVLGASASASDVAHDAVVGLLKVEHPPRFDDPRALRAYLWVAARRLLHERLRKAGRRFARLDDKSSQAFGDALATSGGFGAVESAEQSVMLEVTLHLLPESDREILDLVYFKELDIASAATRLGITSDAAKMRLSRARRSLAHKLGDWTALIG